MENKQLSEKIKQLENKILPAYKGKNVKNLHCLINELNYLKYLYYLKQG